MPPRAPRDGVGRARAEATIVLGREAVEAALADLPKASRYIIDHPAEVRAAVRTILGHLPEQLEEAIAYAASMDPQLREAVAGAWAGGASTAALASLGIEER